METRVVRGVDVVRLAASLGVRFARTQVTPRSSAPNETHVSGQMYQMALYVRSKVASSLRRHKRLKFKTLKRKTSPWRALSLKDAIHTSSVKGTVPEQARLSR
ncbi:hypothetical protein ACU8XX_22130 [Escherichia sp. MAL-1]